MSNKELHNLGNFIHLDKLNLKELSRNHNTINGII